MHEEAEIKILKNRPFERIFKNNIARIIDFFIINEQFYFTTHEISELSETPLRTVQRTISHLVQNNIIMENKSKSKNKSYKLNTHSKLVEILSMYSIFTVNTYIEEAIKQKDINTLNTYNKLFVRR